MVMVPQPVTDVIGKRVGKLVGQEDLGLRPRKSGKGKDRMIRCLCDCGRNIDVRASVLRSETIRSCGVCDKNQSRIKHGRGRRSTRDRTYRIWMSMKQRVSNPKSYSYKNYGGRGITMDPRWEDFENFYADMGDPPSELHTLDRRENDLGYTKANCRWATQEEQSKNKRTSVYLELNGVRKTIGDWASSLGIHSSALRARLNAGWSLEEALTTRKMPNNGRNSSRSPDKSSG